MDTAYSTITDSLRLSNNISFDEIRYFIHVTKETSYIRIQDQHQMSGRVKLSGSNVDRRPELSSLEGLWTLVSLNTDGMLHKKSPYGSIRLAIPIENVCQIPEDWLLFFESTYQIYGGSYKPVNQYVRLILVRNVHPGVELCRRYLTQLDLSHNPFFQIKKDILTPSLYVMNIQARPVAMPFSTTTRHTARCIKSEVKRLCRECKQHVKECAKECSCKCGKGLVISCSCDPHRTWMRLKLFVEVFIVDGIDLDDIPDYDRIQDSSTKVENKSLFFAASRMYDNTS